MKVIDQFYDEYNFLSNFAQIPVRWMGTEYRTAEHVFNAMKAVDYSDRRYVADAITPTEAKRRGREITLRQDWDKVKYAFMRDILYAKFNTPTTKQLLLSTDNAILVEGNTWHDQIWGDCVCPRHIKIPGQNALGTLLMYTRLRLATE